MNIPASSWLILNLSQKAFSLDNSSGTEQPFISEEEARNRAKEVGDGWEAKSNEVLPDLLRAKWERCHY